MNKLAAEKIASEYYELGIKLAQDKLASAFQKNFWNTINALAGAGLGLRVSGIATPNVRNYLGSKSDYLGNVFAKGDAAKALELATERLKIMNDTGGRIWVGPGPSGTKEELAKIISDSGTTLGEGGMSALEKAINYAPGLAIAGGIGAGAYKGLRKLDRWATK